MEMQTSEYSNKFEINNARELMQENMVLQVTECWARLGKRESKNLYLMGSNVSCVYYVLLCI